MEYRDTISRFVETHREKIQTGERRNPYNALIVRPVGTKERLSNPNAMKAMQKEWDALRTKQVWDEGEVREWESVAQEAIEQQRTVHFGWLFGICGEKNYELADGDPLRKFKGRVVFQGNRVVNQSWENALFMDLGSSPATMEGSRAADLYGCAPGHGCMQADAPQAY